MPPCCEAQHDNQISDNFVLTAVLFASVLFFAGIAARFRPQWIRWTMLGVALVVFCIGLVVEFVLPQNVGFYGAVVPIRVAARKTRNRTTKLTMRVTANAIIAR